MRVALVALALLLTVGFLTWRFLEGAESTQVRSVAGRDDSKVLEVTYLAPPASCEAESRIEVEESASRVVIHALVDKGPTGDCPASARLATATVELKAIVGDRTIVDGRNDLVLPLSAP